MKSENTVFLICIGMMVGILLGSFGLAISHFQLNKHNWQCTQASFTEQTLPRVEECTQYTIKPEEAHQ